MPPSNDSPNVSYETTSVVFEEFLKKVDPLGNLSPWSVHCLASRFELMRYRHPPTIITVPK
jgi:hypothetical protein